MKEELARSIFISAGFEVQKMWELANGYWPRSYLKEREKSPWWLVKTEIGLIIIGWRKRVISIDWSDTKVRAIVTEDYVTKDEAYVHAWSVDKAVSYLKALRHEWGVNEWVVAVNKVFQAKVDTPEGAAEIEAKMIARRLCYWRRGDFPQGDVDDG